MARIGSFVSLSILALAFTSACGTVQTAPERGTASVDAKTVLPVPSKRGASEDSGVVLSYGYSGTIAMNSACRLRLINTATKKSYFLTLNSKTRAAYAGLPPGNYETGRLGCGLTKVWEISDLFKNGFKVQAGTVSYLGKINLVFNAKDLDEVKKASRGESAMAYDDALEVAPNGSSFVSGFTLQPITSDMATDATNTAGFQVNGKGIVGDQLNALLKSLQTCDRDSLADDPLRFGRLEYLAAYKNGAFEDFKERKDSNAFSEKLKECISSSLTAFRPTEKAAVEIRVVY